MKRVKSAAKSGKKNRGKSAAPKKPDFYTPEVLREFYERNLFLDCVPGVSFAENEKVNFDPKSGLVVKAGTPGSVPCGETCIPFDGDYEGKPFVIVQTCDDFHREFTLKGKV